MQTFYGERLLCFKNYLVEGFKVECRTTEAKISALAI